MLYRWLIHNGRELNFFVQLDFSASKPAILKESLIKMYLNGNKRNNYANRKCEPENELWICVFI